MKSISQAIRALPTFVLVFSVVVLCIVWLELFFLNTKVSVTVFVLLVLWMIGLGLRRKWFSLDGVSELFVSLSLILVMCSLLELTFWVAPHIFPQVVRNLVRSPGAEELRIQWVEFLPSSPYVKPKANTRIRSPGDYGPESNFAYEWTTDNYGFKNSWDPKRPPKWQALALGDSFTEAMGVPVEDGWAAQLTRKGIATYSAGVQGYAPTQMAGTLRLLAGRIQPKLVFVGYLPSVYEREQFFEGSSEEILARKKFPSAIGRMVEVSRDGSEVRIQSRFVSTALGTLVSLRVRERFRLLRLRFDPAFAQDPRFLAEESLSADSEMRIAWIGRYRNEIVKSLSSETDPDQLAEDRRWQSLEAQFRDIVADANQMGAKVVFILFRHRGEIYARPATGRDLPRNSSGNVEARALERLAKDTGSLFLDTTPAFQAAVSEWTTTTEPSESLYLRYDGHLSAKGNELVSNLIFDFLRTQKVLDR